MPSPITAILSRVTRRRRSKKRVAKKPSCSSIKSPKKRRKLKKAKKCTTRPAPRTRTRKKAAPRRRRPVAEAPAFRPDPAAVAVTPPAAPAAPGVPAAPPSPVAPPPTTGVPIPPSPPPVSRIPVYDGPFGREEATRLLWRAGFGPRPGEVEAAVDAGLRATVERLVRPSGPAVLTGPEPKLADGSPLAPHDLDHHDHLWWLDRMARTNQPLIERMALIWHDWFPVDIRDVKQRTLTLAQNEMFRAKALGTFDDLARAVTIDPAMLLYLDGNLNRRGRPNENYARELMELFTLGADRGAYTEDDVRELARALTGWRSTYVQGTGHTDFRYDPNRHDTGTKTVFGQSGAFGWEDAVRLCLDHPAHPSFFVRKLWSSFVPAPPDAATQAELEALYRSSGRSIAAVVEAILLHPALHTGSAMVKPPVVFAAGLMRALGRTVDSIDWTWRCWGAGQQMFRPPDVSGWNDGAWLDTSTLQFRWQLAYAALYDRTASATGYPAAETPAQALDAALEFFGRPPITPETRQALLDFAVAAVPVSATASQLPAYHAHRQNGLRMLIATSPDSQTS